MAQNGASEGRRCSQWRRGGSLEGLFFRVVDSHYFDVKDPDPH